PPSPFICGLPFEQVNNLPSGDGDQEGPEILGAVQLTQRALFGHVTEPPEDALRDIFLIFGASRDAQIHEPAPSSAHDPLEEPLPEFGGGPFVPSLESRKPFLGDRSLGCHDAPP